jgi:cytosine/adenosine deaminase-related metal-dependent hydrolase
MTGFVNAHTHMYSALAAFGLPAPSAPPRNFVEILQQVWWKLDRALDEPSLRAAARLYVAEALASGTVALIDHHESPNLIEGSLDVLADACDELGMHAVLCYGATERNGGRPEARRGLAECRRFIATNQRPRVRGVVGLHATFTVSDDTIREAGDLCRALDTVLHVHVAEDDADVVHAQARGYAGPVERLDALGALVPGSILAHGVHLTADQVRHVCHRGCWLVQNPRSNDHNGVGYARALRFGSRVALGTDGFPADMPRELDVLRSMGAAAGEDEAELRARLDRSRLLAEERFGRRIDRTPSAPPQAIIDTMRRDAADQAALVCKRMLSLSRAES